ncbi:MAG: hypothetical protein ABFD69_15900 [Candidatus Sumerlaeia bacterium]
MADQHQFPRRLKSRKIVIFSCVFAGLLIFAWNFHVERKFGFCTQCGRSVHTLRWYFSWSTNSRSDFDYVDTSGPTPLYDLWNKPHCTHGGYATMVNGKLTGPEKGDYLISIGTRDHNLLGCGMEGVGWGRSYLVFFVVSNDSVRNELQSRTKADPQFPEKLRHSMQTENPQNNRFVKDLFEDMPKVRKN